MQNARNAVRVETRASLATVENLVADTIRLSNTAAPETVLQTLDLRFRALRHVRVTVLDVEGHHVGRDEPGRKASREAPEWFSDMILPPIERHSLPIRVGGAQRGAGVGAVGVHGGGTRVC